MRRERRDGRSYVYLKCREGRRVRSVYLGKDPPAEVWAEFREARAERQETLRWSRQVRSEQAEFERTLNRASGSASAAAGRLLRSAGFYRHKGSWRRRRRRLSESEALHLSLPEINAMNPSSPVRPSPEVPDAEGAPPADPPATPASMPDSDEASELDLDQACRVIRAEGAFIRDPSTKHTSRTAMARHVRETTDFAHRVLHEAIDRCTRPVEAACLKTELDALKFQLTEGAEDPIAGLLADVVCAEYARYWTTLRRLTRCTTQGLAAFYEKRLGAAHTRMMRSIDVFERIRSARHGVGVQVNIAQAGGQQVVNG